ncbi:hypothetical protein HPB49_000402 [Dermacentor silvarum]|uniref:Uncharacterized protein n=1 Tax=Dermacentor silvarum TaxID=543639 RepID=A0ACB8CIN5_DERSI|nr:hypothetical protein HPB49_000402 [Dermacentor silvarum]
MDALPSPERLVLAENAADNWKFRQRVELYLKATGKERTSAQKNAIFLHLVGKEAIDVFSTFQFTSAEQDGYDTLVRRFEAFCEPLSNEMLESETSAVRDETNSAGATGIAGDTSSPVRRSRRIRNPRNRLTFDENPQPEVIIRHLTKFLKTRCCLSRSARLSAWYVHIVRRVGNLQGEKTFGRWRRTLATSGQLLSGAEEGRGPELVLLDVLGGPSFTRPCVQRRGGDEDNAGSSNAAERGGPADGRPRHFLPACCRLFFFFSQDQNGQCKARGDSVGERMRSSVLAQPVHGGCLEASRSRVVRRRRRLSNANVPGMFAPPFVLFFVVCRACFVLSFASLFGSWRSWHPARCGSLGWEPGPERVSIFHLEAGGDSRRRSVRY